MSTIQFWLHNIIGILTKAILRLDNISQKCFSLQSDVSFYLGLVLSIFIFCCQNK